MGAQSSPDGANRPAAPSSFPPHGRPTVLLGVILSSNEKLKNGLPFRFDTTTGYDSSEARRC
jgi:hypothetical protein